MSGGAGSGGFHHEAVFYRGLDDLASATVPFIREGLEQREPVLVAALPDRIRRLSSALGRDAERVTFLDMAAVGGNPAGIIPVWRRFVHDSAGSGSARGIGEPVWSTRRPEELAECRLHESLLNVAFDNGPAWRLLCPYDADSLPASVVEDARRTHPVATQEGPSPVRYAGHDYAEAGFASPLPAVPGWADRICFDADDLSGLRSVVRTAATRAGLADARARDLVLAAHELATNSILHGRGTGVLHAWTAPGAFVLQVSDSGRIHDPLVGREEAPDSAESGRGIWLVNQLCDLVQVRSLETGTTVRLHSWL